MANDAVRWCRGRDLNPHVVVCSRVNRMSWSALGPCLVPDPVPSATRNRLF
jgi:hypothetical protein